MLSPSLVSPLQAPGGVGQPGAGVRGGARARPRPPSLCFYEGAPSPTHSHLTTLAVLYTGASSLYRTKGLSSH